MHINIGDYVSRNSYKNDTVFKVINIKEGIVFLKGVCMRLCADSPLDDLRLENDFHDDFDIKKNIERIVDEYFYLPGKILHIDADDEYLDRCLKYYRDNQIYAIGKKINEEDISEQLPDLIQKYKPDILVITGHDAYYKKKGSKDNIDNYQNSKHFLHAIKCARKIEDSHEKLIIIAGACQSNYEMLIKAGANFASSPKRINIHALDPAIIAVDIALTKRDTSIDLVKILNKTKYGPSGMGGIMTSGVMYVGYPR